ncbi:MAG TPA: NADH-quinone oxidoreductase subunit N [Candidatus Saccharimonadales bacterium]|nr:NADH-quinone oxidoreductase subunit N [Candidatus Saccharimonadales bacterium]
MNYGELLNFIAPEALLVVTALGVLLIDLTTMRGSPRASRLQAAAGVTVLGCVVAAAALFLSPATTPPGYLAGMLVLGSLTGMVKFLLLALTVFTALITLDSDFTEHIGEFFALLLLATVGMLFLVSTENLLMIFVTLELLSLCLYLMTAFNKHNVRSAEAALKYFLFGGMSAAFLLFGVSLLYGLTGELELGKIAPRLFWARLDPLLMVSLLMVFAGLGFKVAAVPFHLWAPDAYEGAPIPAAALIASGSKVASFFLLTKLVVVGLTGVEGSAGWGQFVQGWVPILALIAALSVVVGNLAAIVQSSVRRLLAYSAVAHAGYLLVGVLAAQPEHRMASVLYYAATYALTTVGAFAVVAVVQEATGSDHLRNFAGLSRRDPLVACCMLVFMLSLAGIPPLAGFFGKFYLFRSALLASSGPQSLGLLWLVVLALLMSAVSLYYYLQVLKQIFVAAPRADAPLVTATNLGRSVLAALALSVVLFGLLPDLLVGKLLAALGV